MLEHSDCTIIIHLSVVVQYVCVLGGVMEHWLRDEAVDKCMKCSADFTFTERKHHCRDCGKIFCHRYNTTAVLNAA